MKKLSKISDKIDVFVISSSKQVINVSKNFIKENKIKNMKVLTKNNRGRDISALLVTSAPFIREYEYICFVHDKKEKIPAAKKDGDFWIENIWDNTICNENYVNNIICKFLEDEELGVLSIPEPIGLLQNAWYAPCWGSSFEETQKVCDMLGVDSPISVDKEPITIGTVFWARTSSLKKLFDYKWSYESFPEEPLGNDGTISHGIERAIGYIAQDAGYKTAIVMNDEYASKMFAFLQYNLKIAFSYLNKQHNYENLYNIIAAARYLKGSKEVNDKAFISRVEKLKEDYGKICIYGAGIIGRRTIAKLEYYGIKPDSIVVTKKESNDEIPGYEVVELDKIDIKNQGVIVAVGNNLIKHISGILEQKGNNGYIIFKDYYK